jgi:hypothetical protein
MAMAKGTLTLVTSTPLSKAGQDLEKQKLNFQKIKHSCDRLKTILKAAADGNKQHILDVANFSKIELFLKKSKLLEENNAMSTMGTILMEYSDNDPRFTSFCVDLLTELNKVKELTPIIGEFILSVSRNCTFIQEQNLLESIELRFFLFLEMIGLLEQSESLTLRKEIVRVRGISSDGRIVFQDLCGKIDCMNNYTVNIHGDLYGNNLVFSGPKSAVSQSLTKNSA